MSFRVRGGAKKPMRQPAQSYHDPRSPALRYRLEAAQSRGRVAR